MQAILNSQYSYLQGRIACKVRSGITCVVFRKTLLLNAACMADFSGGTLQTLMSVDADRVVNLCSSLHELWSLPLQILAALVLLYTQVQALATSTSALTSAETLQAGFGTEAAPFQSTCFSSFDMPGSPAQRSHTVSDKSVGKED